MKPKKAVSVTIPPARHPPPSPAGIRCSHTRLADVASLIPNPRNPNKHPESQIKFLAKIIKHQGWRAPIVVSNRSGFVVVGHGRLEAAKLLGLEKVPVDFQDFATEADEYAHLIADNRLAELAEPDLAGIKDLLSDLDATMGLGDIELTGFTESEVEQLMTQFHVETGVDAEPQMDRAGELEKEWKTKRGQIWELGEHRLMCADSTSDDVLALLGKDSPRLMVTDPPYGVEYDANWRNEAARTCDGMGNRAIGAGAVGKVENDDVADWTPAWKLFQGDVAYVWHAGVRASEVQASIESAGFNIRCQIIWAKNVFAIGRGDYHWQHEPCWYAVRNGKTGHYNGDRTQSTLWQIDKPQKSETGHSTQKPIECMARPIRNNSQTGDLIYEPFSGSGTTIIACEQLGRRCRAVEISPGYVAVTLQRFKDATGKEPRLISG